MHSTKKIKCLVIDDEHPARDVLEKHISESRERLELASSIHQHSGNLILS